MRGASQSPCHAVPASRARVARPFHPRAPRVAMSPVQSRATAAA
jgi:hypothetical protein